MSIMMLRCSDVVSVLTQSESVRCNFRSWWFNKKIWLGRGSYTGYVYNRTKWWVNTLFFLLYCWFQPNIRWRRFYKSFYHFDDDEQDIIDAFRYECVRIEDIIKFTVYKERSHEWSVWKMFPYERALLASYGVKDGFVKWSLMNNTVFFTYEVEEEPVKSR